jgi:very-short-patch-repair endonuclease
VDNFRSASSLCGTLFSMADVVEMLRRCAGSATFAQLRLSHSGRAIRAALTDGRIERVAKGMYALPPATDPLAAARAQGGLVSHQSAALLHGFEVLDQPELPHVTIPRGQHRRNTRLDCELHWSNDVPAANGITTKLRTVVDCIRVLPFDAGLVVADSALRSGAIRPEEMLAAAAKVHGPGRGAARRVAEVADGRAESALESVLRSILIEAGVEGFVPQVVVRHGRFSARIDLADPLRRIALEADGFAHHGTRAALTRDCRRHSNLTLLGWRLIRYSWEDVMFDRDWILESVERAIAGPPNLQAISSAAAGLDLAANGRRPPQERQARALF